MNFTTQRAQIFTFLFLVWLALPCRLAWAETPPSTPSQDDAAQDDAAQDDAARNKNVGSLEEEIGPIDRLIAFARARLPVLGFERHEAEVAGHKLVWWQKDPAVNSSGQPVVMLHGVADQAATWLLVAPAISEGHQIFLVDLPGHGESEPTVGTLKMSTIVAGLEAWLEEYVVAEEQPVTVVGNSMGAWLAALLAHRHPAWIDKAVLINGGPLAPETGDLDLMPGNRQEARALMAAIRDPSFPPTPDAMLDDLVARVEGGPVQRLFAEEADLESHLLGERLGEIEVPVFLVWGLSDRYLGPDFPRRLLEGLPRATMTEIPRCGHIPQVECPMSLMPHLKEILDRLP